MTRSAFIRKWLGNPTKTYDEHHRNEMMDDLDLVIENALRQPEPSEKRIVTFSCSETIHIYEPGCGLLPATPFDLHNSIEGAINHLKSNGKYNINIKYHTPKDKLVPQGKGLV